MARRVQMSGSNSSEREESNVNSRKESTIVDTGPTDPRLCNVSITITPRSKKFPRFTGSHDCEFKLTNDSEYSTRFEAWWRAPEITINTDGGLLESGEERTITVTQIAQSKKRKKIHIKLFVYWNGN